MLDMKVNDKRITFGLVVVTVLVIGLLLSSGSTEQTAQSTIATNYEECVTQGNAVKEDDVNSCELPDGTIFQELETVESLECPTFNNISELGALDKELLKNCTLANSDSKIEIEEWQSTMNNNPDKTLGYIYNSDGTISFTSTDYAERCNNDGRLGVSLLRAYGRDDLPESYSEARKDSFDFSSETPQYISSGTPGLCPEYSGEKDDGLLQYRLLEVGWLIETIEEQ